MNPISTWLRQGTTKTRVIVLGVLKQHPEYGLTTKELYKEAHALYPDATEDAPLPKAPMPTPRSRKGKLIMPPPRPDFPNHPIRSVKYLKAVVLDELKTQGVIEKVLFRTLAEGRPLSEAHNRANMVWRWRLRAPKTEKEEQA